ncbi:MAG: hypothetical protein WC992_08795 [Acholeplasmataceae bacterium]
MATKAVVIEQHNGDYCEFVVSLDGPNPERSGRCFACASREDADKAAKLLDAVGNWCNCTDNKAEGDIEHNEYTGCYGCRKCGKPLV